MAHDPFETYGNGCDEVLYWLGERGGQIPAAREDFKLIIVVVGTQALTSQLPIPIPFATLLGYLFPFYIMLFQLEWNRINMKVGQTAWALRKLEEGAGIRGMQLLTSNLATTHVGRNAKLIFAFFSLVPMALGTLMWLPQLSLYQQWLNYTTGVFGAIMLVFSLFTILRGLQHERDRGEVYKKPKKGSPTSKLPELPEEVAAEIS